MKLLGYAGLSLSGLLYSCEGASAKDKKKGSMLRPSIPPIDRAVPSMIEAATFSLG
ncbi:MAG: hypothetical protein WCQ90_11795 [Deltaproteobacteria bacterium]